MCRNVGEFCLRLKKKHPNLRKSPIRTYVALKSTRLIATDMNAYRISADAIQLVAFLIVLCKIWMYKSSAGVSAKTQILYLLVFTTRHLDLSASHIVYDTSYKVVYMCLTLAVLASIYRKFHDTYEKDTDTFEIRLLIFITLVLSFVCNYDMAQSEESSDLFEKRWVFSEYLECAALWPQLYMIIKTRKVRIGVFLFLITLGLHLILNFKNWVYKCCHTGFYDPVVSMSGIIQAMAHFAFWILCLFGVVKITGEKQSYFLHNLTENDQNSIFVITAPLDKSEATLLVDAKAGGVAES